jgi:hypothetical protein
MYLSVSAPGDGMQCARFPSCNEHVSGGGVTHTYRTIMLTGTDAEQVRLDHAASPRW